MVDDVPDRMSGSPRSARIATEDGFGEVFERAIGRAEIPKKSIAEVLGIKRSHFYRYIAGGDRHLPASWLPLLPRPVLRNLLAELLAPLGMMAAELPGLPEGDGDDMRHVIDAQETTSRAVTKALWDLQDGVVTAAEAADTMPKIDEAISTLLTLRELMARAKTERAIGVRKGRVGVVDIKTKKGA